MSSLRKRLSCILAVVLTIGLIPGFAGNSFYVRAETVQENFCDLTLGMEGDGLTWQLLAVNGQEQRQSVPGGGKIENLLHAGDQVVFQIENPDQIPYINVRAHKPGIRQIGTLKYSEGFADVLSYNETDHIYTLVMPDGNCVVDATAVHVEASSRAQVQVDLTESEQKGSTYTRVYPSLHVEVQTKGADRLTQISYTEDGINWKSSHDFIKDSEGRTVLDLSGFRSPVYENYFGFGEIRVDNICLTVRADLSDKTITTVTNEAELRKFAQAVNDGDAYQSVTVTLGDDIELTEPWTEPIGKDADHSFAGTFDGNGHQISGLDIDYIFTEENAGDHQTQHRKYFGLFGNLSGSVIKNLTVAGMIDIDSTAIDWRYNNSGGYSYIGGITAYARNTEFKNCVSEVNITAHSGYVGGIAGYTYEKDAAFIDCINYGDLTITKRNQSVAGITGGTATSLLRCGNFGTITIDDLQYYAINKPPASSGGGEGTLVKYDTAFGYGAGLAMGACSIRQCCNKGAITGKASIMGGLMSYPLLSSVNSEIIEDSYNTGSIDMTIDHQGISGSYVYTAGLVGKTHPSNSLEIKNSYNAGMISSKATTYGTTGLLYALYHDDGADSSNVPTLDNCYTAASDPSVTAALLNGGERSVWKEDDDQSNGGKPLLYWEKGSSSDETYTVTLDTGEVAVRVQVFRDEAGTDPVEVAEDGTCRLPAGTYYYTAVAEGYFPLKNSFTVVKKDLIVPVTLQKYAEVTLKVKPEAADLTLTDAGGKKMEPSSSSEGVYQFRLNENTNYSYSASAEGYSSVSRQFLAESGAEITVELEKSDYGANDQFIYGDGNEGKVHVVTRGGTYSIGEGATGIMTIDTKEAVTLIGKGISDAALYGDLFINCRKAGTKLTLQDVGISETTNTANLINFTGKDNVLTVEGVCLLDYDFGYTEKHDALIHVPQDGSLTINGAGTLYQYNQTQGAGIGGDTGEMNGEITFAMTGSAFIKGTKQGAVIGAGANAKSSGEAPGPITFESGTYNLETNSRGAAIGGSAGSGGASSGTEVYVRGGSININCDYTGSAVGGGGYVSGNDASGGTVYITGGSLRTYIDKNAASNENGGFNNAAFTEGVNDAVITAQRKNAEGENVYKCVFDTTELGDGPYTVQVDGKEYYSGGRHAWAYVNEALSKDEGTQVNVSRTQDNWIPNDELNLYFYLTGQDHTITVGDQTYQAVFDTSVLDADGNVADNRVYTTGAFTVKKGETAAPKPEVVNYTEASGGSSPATVAFSDNGTDFTVKSEQACAVMLQKADGTVQTLKATASGDAYAYSAEGAAEGDRIVVALKGDTNLDGEMDLFDVIELKAASMGKTTLNDIQKVVSDVVVDEEIDVFDVIELKAASMGKTSLNWQ